MSFVVNARCCSDAEHLCNNCQTQAREHRDLLAYHGLLGNVANERSLVVNTGILANAPGRFTEREGYGESDAFQRFDPQSQLRAAGVQSFDEDLSDEERDNVLQVPPTIEADSLLRGETERKGAYDDLYDTGDMFSQGHTIKRMPSTGGAVPANGVHNQATIVVNEICRDGGLEIPTLQFAPPRKWQPQH